MTLQSYMVKLLNDRMSMRHEELAQSSMRSCRVYRMSMVVQNKKKINKQKMKQKPSKRGELRKKSVRSHIIFTCYVSTRKVSTGSKQQFEFGVATKKNNFIHP